MAIRPLPAYNKVIVPHFNIFSKISKIFINIRTEHLNVAMYNSYEVRL